MIHLTNNFINNSILYQPKSMIIIWAIIFSSDYLMKYWGARLYYKQVKDVLTLQSGYYIKHFPKEKLKNIRYLFTLFIFELFLTSLALWLLLYTTKLYLNWQLYELVCGFFILLEACIHFRHIRTVAFFSLFKGKHSFQGIISIPNYIVHRNAIIEYVTFGIGFLLIFLFDVDNYFVQGGILACLFAFLYHIISSSREKLVTEIQQKNLNESL